MCENGSDHRNVAMDRPVVDQRTGNTEQPQTQEGQSLGVQVSEGISPHGFSVARKDNPGSTLPASGPTGIPSERRTSGKELQKARKRYDVW